MNVKRLRLALLVFVCAGTLSGCEGRLLFEPGKGLGGAEPVMEKDKFQQIDLLSELCSDTSDALDASACDPRTSKEYIEKYVSDEVASYTTEEYFSDEVTSTSSEAYPQLLARAFANFNTRPDNPGNKRRRNGIQERILASSDKLCGDYKMLLRQQQATYNFLVGSGATVLGGLGAIFTHVNTVRALSGAAAILSGYEPGLTKIISQLSKPMLSSQPYMKNERSCTLRYMRIKKTNWNSTPFRRRSEMPSNITQHVPTWRAWKKS